MTGNSKGLRAQSYQTIMNIRATVDKLSLEKSFEKITIREICTGAGITNGTFYHFFPSKDDLLWDRYLRLFLALDEAVAEHLNGDPLELAKFIVHFLLEYTVTRVPNLLLQTAKAFLTNHKRWNLSQTDTSHKWLLFAFERAIEKGLLRSDANAQELAVSAWVMLKGFSTTYAADPHIISRDSYERIMYAWIDSLRTR